MGDKTLYMPIQIVAVGSERGYVAEKPELGKRTRNCQQVLAIDKLPRNDQSVEGARNAANYMLGSRRPSSFGSEVHGHLRSCRTHASCP